MHLFIKIQIIIGLLVLASCSSSYEKLSKNSFTTSNELSKYLLNEYKEKADFEAKQMHDWNSAKLYSEKALAAINNEKILPQKISYWKISNEKRLDLIKAYNNLITVYTDARSIDPYNLAKAISSLDCWSEQQEENWQTWDIKKCRDDFLTAMHLIYNSIDKKNKEQNFKEMKSISKKIIISNNTGTIVTKNKEEDTLQIVYFDFDKSNLTSVNINEIENFIETNKKIIDKYLVIGHTDTVGTKTYNHKLSIERAQAVKKILLNLGINPNHIKILGKGENELIVKTKDEISHPANRRAEISPLN